MLDDGDVFGFVSFWLVPDQHYGHIDNNGVHPDRAGEGWASFMYRAVLDRFRVEGLRYAHVDTGLDERTPAGAPGIRGGRVRPAGAARRVLARSGPAP